ncbi:2-oxo acid dehydrogenase subunit E2 [Halorubrum sp. DTA46]|uniref:2-oxo acid dehydrogenase subunit E2 n=1 Tax=Halorubrum sp. DTA46 TaxID=3402162 RepID=UPI003AAC63D1
MAYIVRMPKLGVEMQRGTLLEWFPEEGDDVEEGDVLAEIESEKSVAEVAARETGIFRHKLLEEGAEVEPGTPMGIVSAADSDVSDLLEKAAEESETVVTSTEEAEANLETETEPSTESTPSAEGTAVEDARMTPKARARATAEAIDVTSIRGTGQKGAITVADIERAKRGERPPSNGHSAETTPFIGTGKEPELVTPRARRRASELNVPLSAIFGSGPHGSVREADVEAAGGAGAPASAGAVAAEGSAGSDTAGRTIKAKQPLSGTRATVARRLSASWEAPHVTVDRRVNAESLFEAAGAADDVVSITDVLFKALSETLTEHPEFNATFEDDVHTVYADHNIGFAIDTDMGLITPVLRNVEDKSVTEIAHSRGMLTDRTLGGRQTADDLNGGTFTVTNLGVLGIDSFTPIINPPQVAILGVNSVKEEPKRTERGIEFGKTIGFSLSFDHRVVDGADAARLLDTLADQLADAPALLEA